MLFYLKKLAYFLQIGYILRLISPKLFLTVKTLFLLLQRPEARRLLSLMKKEKFDFIDIGAFHGVYTNLAIKSKNSDQIILVEANYNSYKFLKEVFKSKAIIIKNKIFSSIPGELSFFIPVLEKPQYGEHENGLGSGIGGRFKNEVELKVKSINLSDLVSCFQSNRNTLIIKVDIEGMEDDFISNLKSTTLNYERIIILIEMSNQNFKKNFALLKDQGFSLLYSGDIYETQDHIFEKIRIK